MSYELLFYGVAALPWRLPGRQVLVRAGIAVLATELVFLYPQALFFVVGVLVAQMDLRRPGALRLLAKAPGLAFIGFAG